MNRKYAVMMRNRWGRRHFMCGFESREEAAQVVEEYGGKYIDEDQFEWDLYADFDNANQDECDWEFEYDLILDKETNRRELRCWRVTGSKEYNRVVRILKAEPGKYEFKCARNLYRGRNRVITNINDL